MRYALILLAAVALAGCAPDAAYVKADRMTKTGTEMLLNITKADHPEIAPDVDDLLVTWEKRLSAAEMRIGATTQPAVGK